MENTTVVSGAGSSPPMSRPDYSVIITCFQEEASIVEFHTRLSKALEGFAQHFEIIYVDDGSTDGTLSVLRGIYDREPIVTCLIHLARNFGQTNAQTAGVYHASGRHIIFMDCDLQLNPEELGLLVTKFEEDEWDMVGGARDKRLDNALRVRVSRAGNFIVSRLLGVTIRDLGCGMKVVDGGLLRAFELGPYHPLDPGALILCVRNIAEVPISHQARPHGRSRWTWRRMLILYHNIFSSLLPSIYPFIVGVLGIGLAAVLAYLVAAGIAPDLFPLPRAGIIVPLLVTLYMILSLGFFLVLGEFMLHGSASTKERAYVERRVWTRAWTPPPSGAK